MSRLLKNATTYPKPKFRFYSFLQLFIRKLYPKPEIINLAGELPDKAIILANHSAKSGPPCLDLYYPKKAVKWSAYQMFGGYKSRRDYLRDILYIKKCGMKPGFGTSFKAAALGLLSPLVYSGMWATPTYPDARFAKTLRFSTHVLQNNGSVMIFPEDSNQGYKDVLTNFFPGFVMLAEKYYRQTGEDVPVYTVYYSVKKARMIINRPLYVQDMVKEGMDRYAITRKFCDEINQLYYDYVADKE